MGGGSTREGAGRCRGDERHCSGRSRTRWPGGASRSWASATSRPTRSATAGAFLAPAAARARVDELLAEGADIIDIGGESTRPGAEPVPAAASSSRASSTSCATRPARGLRLDRHDEPGGRGRVPRRRRLRRSTTSRACATTELARGRRGARARRSSSCTRAGTQERDARLQRATRTTRTATSWTTCCAEWEAAAARARSRGVPARRARHGPGPRLREERAPQHRAPRAARARSCDARRGARGRRREPQVVPHARRRATSRPSERLGASIAAALHAARAGAAILRVHDVRATRQAHRPRRRARAMLAPARRRGPRCSRASSTSSRGARSALVLTDVADILLVTYVVYRALLVLRGTRAMQMGIGLGVIFLVYVVVEVGRLRHAPQPALDAALVDHPHRRRRLPERHPPRPHARRRAGVLRRARRGSRSRKVIDEVVAAATELARHRIGALIAFEQDANLDEFVVGQGTAIDAAVQRELLVSSSCPRA